MHIRRLQSILASLCRILRNGIQQRKVIVKHVKKNRSADPPPSQEIVTHRNEDQIKEIVMKKMEYASLGPPLSTR